MKIRALVILSLLFTGVWSGCSSDDGGSGGTGSTTQASDCAGAAKQFCAKFQSCAPFLFQVSYGSDASRCELGTRLGCEQSTQAPGSKVTIANIGACAAAFNSLSCDGFFSALSTSQPAACQPVPGELADDAACYTGEQCAGNRCVFASSDADCGKCASPTKAGADCSAQTSVCERGYYCDGKVCTQQVAEGGSCPMGNECKDELACTEGKCVTPKIGKKGEACGGTTGVSCDLFAGLTCLPTSFSDPNAGSTCSQATLAGVGAACGLVDNAVVICEAGGDCSKDTKKCVAAAKEGEACDAQNGPDCLEPAECKAGKCVLPGQPTCK